MSAETSREGEAASSIDADDKELSCEHCEKSYQSKPALNSHVGQMHPGESKVTKECLNCGSEVTRIPARMNRSEKTFCSRSCSGEYSTNSCEFLAEDHPDYARVTVNCDFCGSEHERPRYKTKDREYMYCSRSCHVDHILERDLFHDENSALYNPPADTDYGENWQELRDKVRKRDDYQCQGCGVMERNYQRELDVHHIIPLRKFRTIERANELDNLVSLCMTCHNRWEGIPLRPQT